MIKIVSPTYPKVNQLQQLLIAIKKDICDSYRETPSSLPGIKVTIGWSSVSGKWDYQTGDLSFTGGAYGYPHWATVELYRRSNCKLLAYNLINQLKEYEEYGKFTHNNMQ